MCFHHLLEGLAVWKLHTCFRFDSGCLEVDFLRAQCGKSLSRFVLPLFASANRFQCLVDDSGPEGGGSVFRGDHMQ